MSSLERRTHSWRIMKEPFASKRLRSALNSLSKLSMNCLKWGEVELLEEVGELEASIGLPVFEEEISANTSKSSTTTWKYEQKWKGYKLENSWCWSRLPHQSGRTEFSAEQGKFCQCGRTFALESGQGTITKEIEYKKKNSNKILEGPPKS